MDKYSTDYKITGKSGVIYTENLNYAKEFYKHVSFM